MQISEVSVNHGYEAVKGSDRGYERGGERGRMKDDSDTTFMSRIGKKTERKRKEEVVDRVVFLKNTMVMITKTVLKTTIRTVEKIRGLNKINNGDGRESRYHDEEKGEEEEEEEELNDDEITVIGGTIYTAHLQGLCTH